MHYRGTTRRSKLSVIGESQTTPNVNYYFTTELLALCLNKSYLHGWITRKRRKVKRGTHKRSPLSRKLSMGTYSGNSQLSIMCPSTPFSVILYSDALGLTHIRLFEESDVILTQSQMTRFRKR
ncbi:hypothetical protein TNIN_137971 [Trichonephila inaurata madagascariensis]|uniref:Uncharacterized protein n=1 Tax=Trichonephila inaurata madagascariensis TaxID=2747483 RepID=A0A8X6X3Y1_9ARAC|nr:hypothetical protein TNIN_137971 [Trichonephila inaurata madagascariensis]